MIPKLLNDLLKIRVMPDYHSGKVLKTPFVKINKQKKK